MAAIAACPAVVIFSGCKKDKLDPIITVNTQPTAPRIQVINVTGVVVYVQKITGADETINLDHLPAGMYLFRFKKDERVCVCESFDVCGGCHHGRHAKNTGRNIVYKSFDRLSGAEKYKFDGSYSTLYSHELLTLSDIIRLVLVRR